MQQNKEANIMNELKKYIVPSAHISIFKSDIITSSPVGGGNTDDGGINLDEDLDAGLKIGL